VSSTSMTSGDPVVTVDENHAVCGIFNVNFITNLLSGLTVENQSACGKVAGKGSGTFFVPSCIKDDPFLF